MTASTRGEEGSGSVLVLALVATSLMLAAGAAVGGQLAVAASRAATAADAAALAAATAATGASDGAPCSAAARTARAAGAHLLRCTVDATGVADTVAGVVPPAAAGALVREVSARSRAGPQSTG